MAFPSSSKLLINAFVVPNNANNVINVLIFSVFINILCVNYIVLLITFYILLGINYNN